MPHHQIKKQAQALPDTWGHTGDLIPPVCALRLFHRTCKCLCNPRQKRCKRFNEENAYFVIQGIGLPCSNIPGPKGVVSPVSGLVGWSI